MTITIFGATGQVGTQVMQQALAKNYTVKAFGRNVENLIDKDLHNDKFTAIHGYVFDEVDVFNAIQDSDAVISCLGGSIDGTDKTRSLGMKNIVSQMQKSNVKRIIAIGGLGVLNSNETTFMMNEENFEEQYMPVSLEHLSALEFLENSGLDYTFICPPQIINQDPNFEYTTNLNYLPVPNKWQISSGNLAACMLQCLEKKEYIKSKIGISNL